MTILSALIGPVADLATGFLKNKAEEKQAKHQAKMSVYRTMLIGKVRWQMHQARAGKTSSGLLC